jgi:hypothetical protein
VTYPNVILLTGRARSGKDTAAKFLTEQGWVRVAFADPLREVCVRINPQIALNISETISVFGRFQVSQTSVVRLSEIVERVGWDTAKQIPEVRRLLQVTGTEAIRGVLGDSTWTNLALEKVAQLVGEGKKVVVTDCRFANEALAFRQQTDFFACVYRIVREGSGAGNHSSEAGIPDALVDVVIDNNGSMEELKSRILELAGETEV